MSSIAFTKMHGAGNDFVMVAADDLGAVELNRSRIAAWCDRRTGVGADGLIVLGKGQPGVFDFRMTYYNADGGEAEMCGNGARCSVAFAHDLGWIETTCRFATGGGVLSGKVHGPGDMEVSLGAWKDLDLEKPIPGSPWSEHHHCNTGVPHLIIPVTDIEAVDLERWGPALRHHDLFQPAGVNVNWVAPSPVSDGFALRTFERGVEAETLACGTGASAAAVVLCHLERAVSPVHIHTRGGDRLTIGVDPEGKEILLRGPALVSFKGEVTIHD